MNDERLISLGATLQQEFQALVAKFSTGWLDNASLKTEDLDELRLVESDVYRMFRVDSDFVELEQSLTSGFFPADLARAGTDWGEPLVSKNPVASSRFPEANLSADGDQSWAGHATKWTEKAQQEASASEAASPPLTNDQHQRPVKGLKDLARFLESAHHEERTAGENSGPESGFTDENDVAFRKTASESSLPDDRFLSPMLARKVDTDEINRSPRDDANSASGGEKVNFLYGHQDLKPSEAAFQQPESSNENFFSWLLPEEENRNKANPVPFPSGRSQRDDVDEHVFKKQGLKASTATSFDALKAKTPRGNAWAQTTTGHNLSIHEQRITREAELGANEEPEYAKRPDHASDLDLHDILEALAREIQREYKRFYGS